MTKTINDRITFDHDAEVMEVDFSGFHFDSSHDVNAFYDRLEERIADTGETLWFFLVNLSGMRIDPSAWGAYAKRGKALNMAHSQGSVRFDASEETRRQIERAAQTEAFDPNLFADREGALARIAVLPSKRTRKIQHTLSLTAEEIAARIRFLPDAEIMDVDFSNVTFAHSADVNAVYDALEARIADSGRKWYFLVNYENCKIFPEAWVAFAQRGKALNLGGALGSVRYAPGSETEETIRMRAETQDFRPNIRNTREEALARIQEIKKETV